MNTDYVIMDALSSVGLPAYREIPPPDRLDSAFLVYSELPGTSDWPGAVERVSYVIEAWVGNGLPQTRMSRAKSVGDEARMALRAAWQTRRKTVNGGINYIGDMPRPTLTPTGLDGVYRTTATYDMTIRP